MMYNTFSLLLLLCLSKATTTMYQCYTIVIIIGKGPYAPLLRTTRNNLYPMNKTFVYQ